MIEPQNISAEAVASSVLLGVNIAQSEIQNDNQTNNVESQKVDNKCLMTFSEWLRCLEASRSLLDLVAKTPQSALKIAKALNLWKEAGRPDLGEWPPTHHHLALPRWILNRECNLSLSCALSVSPNDQAEAATEKP